MRRASIFVSILAFCAAGLMAQDDLAQYQAQMKAAAQANGAARKAIAAKDTAAASEAAKKMATAFDEIATFWHKKGKDDAVKLSETARDAAKATAAASTPEAQQAELEKAGATCRGCHSLYRAGDNFKGL
jgi:hypothetical protein